MSDYTKLLKMKDTKCLLNLNLPLNWPTLVSGLIYENSITKDSHLQWELLGQLLGIWAVWLNGEVEE